MDTSGPGLSPTEFALKASGIGVWQFNVRTKKMILDNLSQKLFCYPEAEGHYPVIFAFTDGDSQQYINRCIEQALLTGTLNCSYLPLNSNDYIQVKGKAVATPDGDIFYGTVQPFYKSLEQPEQSRDILSSIIAESPIAIGLYVGRELVIGMANDVLLSYWGKTKKVIGKRLGEAIPELEGQPFLEILDNVFTTGDIYNVTEAPVFLALNGVPDTYYFDFTYKPLFDNNGQVYAILNTAVNVTDRVIGKKKLLESDSRFRDITEQSPMAICLLMGREMVVKVANNPMLKIWGKDETIMGLPLIEALPEIKGQEFIELLDKLYTTGVTIRANEALVKLEHENVLTDVYVDFSYSALRDEAGTINGVLVLASDATDRVMAMREIAASEEKFRSVIYSAQAAVAVFKGYDLIGDIVNDEFLRFVSRTKEEFIGKPLLESMPELHGQPSIGLMREVLEKGIKTHHYGRRVDIMRDGILTTNYYNVSYSPLYDATGSVYGVLDIAIDVTETIKAQEAQREAEASLRGAIELADLGTWSLNPVTGKVTYSKRMQEWFGLDGNPVSLEEVIAVIAPADRERVVAAVQKSTLPESDGHYDEEYTVINRINNTERVLHAQGRTFFDSDGTPYLMSGTAQDITVSKKIQQALENEVKERTEALLKANLELEEINQKLTNTNQELEQYAYVASHDLQEPLRKITMFSNLLKERDTQNTHAFTIDKIVKASDRMSMLIKDLLEFSRLLNPDTHFVSTNLETIVKNITHDFDLLIEEKGAELIIGDLPVIEAVPLQMSQLFYNLTGNALKFVSADKKPVITISAERITFAEASLYVKNPSVSAYYKIMVQDNGIGIEDQYKKQIFEVFKRLHTRSEYSGSGIGLAICKRIVNHHNGSIYVESVPGEGTRFFILLPEVQPEN
ncbi:PAS domain-containing protein [Flavobacterium sp. RHBU_24]|uniref:PAS domain-containing protein n=1 Tax=Flavobacterium sp. RHBU_24 TaxID=3391185 RepID=UPI0039855204